MADHNAVVSKIIQCVKQYPALYDTTNEDYNRYLKKIEIWNSIAAEVNYSDGKSVQTKWRNIRDSYVKHLKSLRTMEPAYKKYRNWQWVDQMSFLKKFLGGNKHKNNVKIEKQETSSMIEVVYGTPSTHNAGAESPLWFGTDSLEQIDYDGSTYQKDYILENNGIDPNVDATDLLFLSYAKTLKTLNKKRQIQARMKISEIMCQAELEEENENNSECNHVDSSQSNNGSKNT